MQEHSKKLAYRHDHQDHLEAQNPEEGGPKEQEEAHVGSSNRNVAHKKQDVTRGPETVPSEVSPSAINRIKQMRSLPSSSIVSSGSDVRDGQGNEYNYPRQPKQKIGGRHKPCTICAIPLELSKLTERAWRYALTFPSLVFTLRFLTYS